MTHLFLSRHGRTLYNSLAMVHEESLAADVATRSHAHVSHEDWLSAYEQEGYITPRKLERFLKKSGASMETLEELTEFPFSKNGHNQRYKLSHLTPYGERQAATLG